ncbi:unnamed protein product [Ostreobium quekettii]|uniref:Glycoside hydrolase family 38 N-terminal domain-containing protein n=1 Tax=Ostreobium quekettii TaxID=121088 RepID=A0A8S1IYK4_9CHLO|nr:unnamed protein product [Ostreobium quekettii]
MLQSRKSLGPEPDRATPSSAPRSPPCPATGLASMHGSHRLEWPALALLLCLTALWGRSAAAGRPPPGDLTDEQRAAVETVYLVSSCHLDVGFKDSAANITNLYFDQFFPDAVRTSARLRALGGEERLVFLTHSYLVSLYLSCPPGMGLHCPNMTARDAFLQAVVRGDVTWHAFPFNAQLEVYDESLADFGFAMTHELDDAWSRRRKTTMSQRDVPGTTRSAIRIMARNGVQALTVGVNKASMPPAVGPAFVWRDPGTGEEVLAMWHPHGYGNVLKDGIDSVVAVPGLPVALAFAIRGDNSGPPSIENVTSTYAVIKDLFPNARIVASGYDEFVERLEMHKSQLPVFTGEIGDTWIHGAASDPLKTAEFREVQRQRAACLGTGACSLGDPRVRNFSRLLMKYGEHTWGKDVKTFFNDTDHWSNAAFDGGRGLPNATHMVASWVEQRDWALKYALEALRDHPLRRKVARGLRDLRPGGRPAVDGKRQGRAVVECGAFRVAVDEETMSVVSLVDARGPVPVEYAGEDHPLGRFVYQSFSSDDFAAFLTEYFYIQDASWAWLDFDKTGLGGASVHQEAYPRMGAWSVGQRGSGSSAVCVLRCSGRMPDSLVHDYGAPAEVGLEISVPIGSRPDEEVRLGIAVSVFNKTTTRLPESLSVFFRPSPEAVAPDSMVVSKLGEPVSVLDVVKNGSTHVHGSDGGVMYTRGRRLAVASLDTNLVTVGGTNAFPTPVGPPDPSAGFGFNIYNNIWCTNYIMWYPYLPRDGSQRYRMVMTIPPATEGAQSEVR